MNDNEINDKRETKEFKSISFSGYKKSQVRKELLKNLNDGKIEQSCYWSAELLCAGHLMELWEIILLFISKHIHLGNPKIVIYIQARYEVFKEIVSNGYIGNEIKIRNNDRARKLFAEIMGILCYSPKKHTFEPVKLNKIESYDVVHLKEILKADKITYAQSVYRKDDPKELFISINEFAYNISKKVRNSLNACYWFEWIAEFEMKCKAKKENCICERREFAPVEDKYQMDAIWIIWELLLQESDTKGKFYKKILETILQLFCIRYKDTFNKKRRYLMYFAINLITEPINESIPMLNKQEYVTRVAGKIGNIYQQIKKNEESPGIDYLFNGTERSNLEKTIQKMDIMNKISGI